MKKKVKRYFKHHKHKLSAGRLAALADGLIAIIITLMILEIPLPETMRPEALFQFGKSILIFFCTFVVVGEQWHRHHHLMHHVEEVTDSFIWKNLLYLFLLSLLPLFMKWMLTFPDEVIPTFCYAGITILCHLAIQWLNVAVVKEQLCGCASKKMACPEMKEFRHVLFVRNVVMIILYFVVLGISYFVPKVGIVCFIGAPMLISISHLRVADDVVDMIEEDEPEN